jgi:hypothetical protein
VYRLIDTGQSLNVKFWLILNRPLKLGKIQNASDTKISAHRVMCTISEKVTWAQINENYRYFPLLNHHQPINIPTAGAQDFLIDLHIRRMGHNPPREPSAKWWVLTTTNAAGTNSLTCLSKHGVARNNTYLVTDQRCLTSVIARANHTNRGAIEFLLPNYGLIKFSWQYRGAINACLR